MNEGASTTLSLTADKTLDDDLLMKGFVGTTFDGMSWGRGDWMSYEGEWSGMREWLRQNGLTVAEQRAAFDTETEREGGEPVEAVEISVNASGANRRYTYAPYTLRSLSGADAMLTGSTMLSMDPLPSKTYSVTVDNVPSDDVIADSSWLASSKSDYAKASGYTPLSFAISTWTFPKRSGMPLIHTCSRATAGMLGRMFRIQP